MVFKQWVSFDYRAIPIAKRPACACNRLQRLMFPKLSVNVLFKYCFDNAGKIWLVYNAYSRITVYFCCPKTISLLQHEQSGEITSWDLRQLMQTVDLGKIRKNPVDCYLFFIRNLSIWKLLTLRTKLLLTSSNSNVYFHHSSFFIPCYELPHSVRY